MSLLLVLILFCNLTYTFHADGANVGNRRLQGMGHIGIQSVDKKDSDQANQAQAPNEVMELTVHSHNSEQVPEAAQNKQNSMDEVSAVKSSTIPPVLAKNDTNVTGSDHKRIKQAEMESGALLRGVLVVVALSVIVIIYMAVKTYYSKRNKPVMVSKYGVRTRRSDIEMTPLPLEEDDDDETLFEVGGATR